jgi:predicted dehydrogenase
MAPLRFAIFGTGFWARFQLAAWRELAGVECVALYNRTLAKAEALGRDFGIEAVYDDPVTLLDDEEVDFIDIITDVDTHPRFVELAAQRKLPVICQKPMAPNLASAEAMVAACHATNTPLFIHENWRWQQPIRAYKAALARNRIGTPFRTRIHYCSSFPVFANQPFLADLEQFILTDIGSHLFDVVRYLFGEPRTVYCRTHHVFRDLKGAAVKGEDAATVVFGMANGMTVTVECSYASRTEIERFPETYIYTEGSEGFLELGPDFWLRETNADGTWARKVPPPRYAWADPAYDVVHASIVACNADLLAALRGEQPGETTSDDNLRTVRTVYAAYDSAAQDRVITLPTYP